MKRGFTLGAAGVCVFVLVAGVLLKVMPAPFKESDYMVIGSVAIGCLALGFLLSRNRD